MSTDGQRPSVEPEPRSDRQRRRTRTPTGERNRLCKAERGPPRARIPTVSMWSDLWSLARAGPLLTWSGVLQSRSAAVTAQVSQARSVDRGEEVGSRSAVATGVATATDVGGPLRIPAESATWAGAGEAGVGPCLTSEWSQVRSLPRPRAGFVCSLIFDQACHQLQTGSGYTGA